LYDFLKQPKAFAYAGFLAMIPKLIISLSIGVVLSVLARRNACFALFMLSYPFVALIVDGLLYVFRNRLWKPLPDNAVIPPEWQIEATELEKYAKNLPKIRFMRLATVFVLMLIFVFPFATEKSIFTTLFHELWFFFFISVLFDPVWRRVLKIKKPKILNSVNANVSESDVSDDFDMNEFDDLDPMEPGSMAWNNAQTDPSIPGTPAWTMQQ